MKKNTFILAAIVLIGAIAIAAFTYSFQNSQKSEEQKTHYHAAFGVVLGGELQDYSTIDHMYYAPCGEASGEDGELLQEDRAHLHDMRGDVVHVHDTGVTWDILLGNLGAVSDTDEWNMYSLRDHDTALTVDSEIAPYEGVIISSTPLSDEEAAEFLGELPTELEVREYEKTSIESCGI